MRLVLLLTLLTVVLFAPMQVSGQTRITSSQIDLETLRRLMELDGWTTSFQSPPYPDIEPKPIEGKKAILRKRWIVLNEPMQIVAARKKKPACRNHVSKRTNELCQKGWNEIFSAFV